MAEPVSVRIPEELLEWADRQPGSRTETIVGALERQRRATANPAGLSDELAEAWRILAEIGEDQGDRCAVRLEVAESRLAERMKVSKESVRGQYVDPLRRAGLAHVGGFAEVFVRVPKPPEDREEVAADV